MKKDRAKPKKVLNSGILLQEYTHGDVFVDRDEDVLMFIEGNRMAVLTGDFPGMVIPTSEVDYPLAYINDATITSAHF